MKYEQTLHRLIVHDIVV